MLVAVDWTEGQKIPEFPLSFVTEPRAALLILGDRVLLFRSRSADFHARIVLKSFGDLGTTAVPRHCAESPSGS